MKLTQEGIVVGSPTYMSPEQCRGLELDGRSDIYSLGCVMFEVLGGKRPFDAPYPFAILVKQVSMPPPKLTAAIPELKIDPELESIVYKTLQKNPGLRYNSMEELKAVLVPFTRDNG